MFVFMNAFIFVAWLIIGLNILCEKWRYVSKFDYGLCWALLMVNLLMNWLRVFLT